MSQDLGLWLRGQRQARGWSAAEMARRIQQAARSSGDNALPGHAILATYVRRWERGPIGPTERYRLHYCKAFGISLDQLGVGTAKGQTGLSACPGPSSCQAPAGGPGTSRGLGEPDRYRDREGQCRDAGSLASLAGAGVSADQLITEIADESQDFGEWADTSNVGDSTLERYATQVRHLARDYEHESPLPLLLNAGRLRDRVFTRLQGHQRPGQTRELYLVAAQVCGLLAWMSGDLNSYRAAGTHAWTAWVCAEQADHDGARAWVRATQSKLAYWDARYVESEQLAADGLRFSGAGSCRAMLGLFRGRALARLGRGSEAAEALTGTEPPVTAAGPDEIGGVWGVTPARCHGLASNAHLWRNDPAQALAEAELALELFEAEDPSERNYGAEAHTRIDQARARVMLCDLDGASAALRPVLALPAERRYEPVTQELSHIRQALAVSAHDAALARQLQEEIEAYSHERFPDDAHSRPLA